jgi:hypothetical protein
MRLPSNAPLYISVGLFSLILLAFGFRATPPPPALLTLAITSFNRGEMLIASLPGHLAQPLVGEVVIAVDANTNDANVLREWLASPTSGLSKAMANKVRVFPTSFKHGALRNKVRAIQLASHDWVALIDSDNIVGNDYFSALSAYWLVHYGSAAPPPTGTSAASHVFCPETLRGTSIDYTSFRREVGAVDISTWQAAHTHPHGHSFMNTGNYVLHKSVLRAWEPLAAEDIEPFGMDVLVMNKRLVEMGYSLHTVEGMAYKHVVHTANLWTLTAKDSIDFLRNFSWALSVCAPPPCDINCERTKAIIVAQRKEMSGWRGA